MTSKRTQSNTTRRANLPGLALGLALAVVGFFVLTLPFAYESVNWRWDLREQKNWEGAKINAQPLGLDETGVLFSPLGNRPISLLSPPLHLHGDLGGILIVMAQCPETPTQGVRANVRLLWQTEARPDFHIEEQIVRLGRKPTEIVFGLPARATELHRVGVQFMGVTQNLRTTGIEIPSPSPGQKLDYFAQQLAAPEPILNHSINFVGGPILLGHSTNYYVLALMVTTVGGYLVSRFIVGWPIRWATMGFLLLVIWVAADIPATWRFARQVANDLAKFGDLDATGKIAAAHGGEVAWAYEELAKHSPAGATFTVVSDDTFTPAHRLGYLAAPLRSRCDHPADADLVFVCYSGGTAFDASKGELTIGDQPPIHAAEVARLSPDVYLLRNISHLAVAETDRPPSRGPLSLSWLLLGLIAPWGAGMALVALLGDGRWNRVGVVGAGWLAGQVLTVTTLSVTLLSTNTGRARAIVVGLAVLTLALWWIVLRLQRTPTKQDTPNAPENAAVPRRPTSWPTWGVALLMIILATRLYYMGLSHWTVTARCDDAISMWLFKAKAIAKLDRLPTDPAHDYYLGGSNPNYPLPCPLIAAWLPMVAGQWEERIATLPWLLCYLNLLLLIGGGLCRWLTGAQATAAAYIVGSLPLMAMHVVRPGYADLMLAAFLSGAVLFLVAWRVNGRLGDLLLGGIFALTAACLKREGPPVVAIALVFLVGTAWRQFAVYPRILCWGLAAAAVAGAALTFVVVGFSDHAENVSAFGYHSGIWNALGRHLFIWDSFHALFWIVAVLLPALVWRRSAANGLAPALLILAWCGLIAAIFVFTPQARFALNDQTPSRLFLQVTPAIIVLLAASLGPTMSGKGKTLHGNL